MIEYLKGQLTDLQPTMATVECHGVGYGVNISLNTYAALQGKDLVKVYISESIREDAYQLWGFSSRMERELFLLLCQVSGIGAATARMVLSAMTPQELCSLIQSGNDKMLKQIKGIGPKAAQRIIVELQDKILSCMDGDSGSQQSIKSASQQVDNQVMDEAVSALTMLGFAPAPTHKVVVKILTEDPTAPVEKVIKMALKML